MKNSTTAAIYTFCAHYHSGQSSRGYRLLCRAGTHWQRRNRISVRLDYWERLVSEPKHINSAVAVKYRYLVENYAHLV